MAEINLLEQTLQRSKASRTKEEEMKKILEALFLSSSDPIGIEKLKKILSTLYPVKISEIRKYIQELNDSYRKENKAFKIKEIAGGFILYTTEEVSSFVSLLYNRPKQEKLSKAATEVLAIIAYQGPKTRAEIDKLRGVDCSKILSYLLEKGLVKEEGRRTTVGRPMQYATTQKFLTLFGLNDLSDLKRF